jgi:TM2 domain-containing membrane protein YozV
LAGCQGVDGVDEVATPYNTETMMRYDANKKSVLLGYVLWFFLGFFGVHRMYLGRTGSGIAMLILHGLSWLTYYILIGFVGFAVLGLWWLIDAVLIPGMARSYNNRLVDDLTR